MKKLLVLCISLLLMVGCSSTESSTGEETNTPSTDGATIAVYTRDASSGTRSAFEEAIGLESITADSIEVSSNGDMATKVSQNENAIGYVSLTTDFEANNIKPLSYNGVSASIETTIDGTYTMSRPFAYVTRATGDFDSTEKEQLIEAFVAYITLSTEGLLVVESAGGIVDITSGTPWAELKANYPIVDQDNTGITITTAGSTSVSKTLEAALASFQPMAGNFNFATNQTGSSDGFKRTLGEEKDGANAADIGFASRPFKDTETVADGAFTGTYCLDAVVAVVSPNNALEDISTEDLNAIYSGTITTFSEVE